MSRFACFAPRATRAVRAAALILLAAAPSARAEKPAPAPAPVTLQSLPEFEISPGYQLELVAAEPITMDPVDMAWDETGRLFVLEMPGYPIAKKDDTGEYPGRIVALEDANNDGVYDKRTFFAGDFAYADSMLPWRGGLLVMSPPDLLYLKDTDGDGKADERRVMLTGFMAGNAQHNFNGLTWGLDNWVWMTNGGNPGVVKAPGAEGKGISLDGRDARFDPATGRLEPTAESSGGHGLALDDWGHIFTTHNTVHVNHTVFPQRYLDRNPHVELGGTSVFIGGYAEGSLTRIYPIGKQETRLNHPEQSGYFSGSCGITYYGGGAFGAEGNGSLFVGDVVLNLAHRMKLRPEGPIFVAERGEGEEKREFFATTDRAFRPVNFKTGPDGAFYMMDFHRVVIEHPEWIPDELEKDMDVRAGDTQGRIYRIVPKGGLPRVKPKFNKKNLTEAVAALGHSNKWFRDAARRMLVEWQAKPAVPAIRDLWNESPNPLARLHAMWTLEGLGALEDADIIRALSDKAAGMRENALMLAEPRLTASAMIRDAVFPLARDIDARVRMQTALTLGELTNGDNDALAEAAMDRLAVIARADAGERWTREAILSGLGRRPAPEFAATLARAAASPEQGEYLKLLAEIIGSRKQEPEVAKVLAALAERPRGADGVEAETLAGLASGLARGDRAAWMSAPPDAVTRPARELLKTDQPAALRQAWLVANQLGIPPGARQRELLAAARAAAGDPSAPAGERVEQLRLLAFAPFAERSDLLFDLLDQRQPTELQMAAMDQIADGPNEEVAPKILKVWKKLGPDARGRAGNILLHRRPNHPALLDAFENGDILIGQMNMDLERRRALLRSPNADIRARAQALFTDAGVVTRADALERLKPALQIQGDPARGHEVFLNLCSKCHMISGEGAKVGPDLTEIFRKSGETLLHDIIDPNAAVNTEFMSYTLETNGGEILSGIIAEQSAAAITLRQGGSKDLTLPRAELKEITSNGLSLMPEELEKDMKTETMADLLSFLQKPK